MKKIWIPLINFIKNHKKISTVIVILIIAGFWYYHSTTASTATTYTVKPATIGSIRTMVSGTGQVSSSQELGINPQVSGTVLTVNVKNGDTVTKGQVLATLDSTNAYYSLENARISLQKLQTSTPISETNDQNSLANAQSSQLQAYQSAFSSVSSAYNSMGQVVTGLNNLFYGKDASAYFTETAVGNYGSTAISYRHAAGLLVDAATAEYNAFQSTYLATSITSTSSIEASLAQELQIAQDIASAVKNTSLAVNYVVSQVPQANHTNTMTSDQNNIVSWLSSINQNVSGVAGAQTSLQNAAQSIVQAQSNLDADQGTNNPLALQSAKLALQEAQTTYDDYTITAPFSGIIGNVTISPGDNAGPSTLIGTIVTKQYQSTIVLNEINVAKVAVGQPVEVTFNALPGVTATGTVTDVDAVGTVSQGVVSYNVVISYANDNPSIKAGMSINANIITSEVDNVVIVPNGAVKTINGMSYVQVPANGSTTSGTSIGSGRTFGSSTRMRGSMASSTMASTTRVRMNAGTGTYSAGVTTVTEVVNKPVQIGLSDNTNTQIVSGINAGDLVVTQTITGTSAKTTGSASILSTLGGARQTAGGGGFAGRAGGFGGGR